MALEDATQRVSIEGSDEVIKAFNDIGAAGAEAFAQIVEAASHGDFTGLATMVGGQVAGSFAEATKAVAEFVESTSAAIVKTAALSEVFGTTLEQTTGLQEAFSSAGVSANTLDRLMQRMSMRVSANWSSIEQSVREAGSQSEAAMQRVTSATLGVEKAQENLAEQGTKSAQQAQDDFNSIQKAALSLEEAQNKFTTASGGSVSPGAKQALEQRQALLALREAQEAVGRANQKAVEDSIKADQAQKEAIEGVKAAQLKLQEAQEHQYDVSLKNIPEVVNLLKSLESGSASAADKLKVADVSTQALSRAIEQMASATGKMPTGFDMLMKLSEVFKSGALSIQQETELVQRFGVSMRGAGGDAAKVVEALKALTPETLKELEEEAKKAGLSLSEGMVKPASDLEAASAKLSTHWGLLKDQFATAISPGMTTFLTNLDAGLRKVTPALVEFGHELSKVLNYLTAHPVLMGALGGGGAGLVAAGPIGGLIGAVGGAAAAGLAPLAFSGSNDDANKASQNHSAAADKQNAAANKQADAANKMGAVADKFASVTGASNPNSPLPSNASMGSNVGNADVVNQWHGGLIRVPGYSQGGLAASINKGLTGSLNRNLPSFANGGLVTRITSRLKTLLSPGFASGGGMTEDDINEAYDVAIQQADIEFESSKRTPADSDRRRLARRKAQDEKDKALAELYKHGTTIGGGYSGAPDTSLADWQASSMPGTVISGAGPGSYAEGGHVRGPGTGTSDSIIARISNGEFVQRASAVRHYGTNVMDAINSLRVPKNVFQGFANGGLVGHLPRYAGGGAVTTAPHSVLNLTIGSQTFRGLKAPANTAAQLKSYAISQQTTKTGNMPSWMK